jgi:hypothetical protein
MQQVNRLVKGLIGALIGTFFFSSMTVMACVSIFGLNQKETTYKWVTGTAFIIGIVVGAIVLSKAKWWHILVLAVVVLIMFMIVMSQY